MRTKKVNTLINKLERIVNDNSHDQLMNYWVNEVIKELREEIKNNP